MNDERDEGKEELNDFQPARDTSKHVPEARHGNFVRKTITRIYCAVITFDEATLCHKLPRLSRLGLVISYLLDKYMWKQRNGGL